jgi:hypothetical protein
MKTKNFRNGKYACKSYLKPAGRGYEVGFTLGGAPLFVGNFIHSSEANQWYSRMNQEIKSFSKKHPVGKTYPKTWFSHFLKSHLYKNYYSFLDKTFTRHEKSFTREFKKNQRKYKKLKSKWQPKERTPALKAA